MGAESIPWGEFFQGGGLLVFAYVVYRKLDQMNETMVRHMAIMVSILERQSVTMERQKIISESLIRGGVKIPELPAPPSMPKFGATEARKPT
jgi:hypothetical protein